MDEIYEPCFGSNHDRTIEIDFYQWKGEIVSHLETILPKNQIQKTIQNQADKNNGILIKKV